MWKKVSLSYKNNNIRINKNINNKRKHQKSQSRYPGYVYSKYLIKGFCVETFAVSKKENNKEKRNNMVLICNINFSSMML